MFTAIAPGALQAGAFHTGSSPSDADDRIIFDASTGALSYDPYGTGASPAVLFAQLTAGLNLSGSDFVLL